MTKKLLLTIVASCLLAMLLAACKSITPPPPNGGQSAADTAFAVNMPALTLGTQQNLVYYTKTYSDRTHFVGVIRRYDTARQKAVAILTLPDVSVQDAQVSPDGQWILYVARLTDHDELRIVRLDGMFKQTLLNSQPYGTLSDIQWSPNQQYVLFDEKPPQSGPFITYLLDILQHHLQVEIAPSNDPNALSFAPRKWLDTTHALLVGTAPGEYATPQNIYLLDIQKGAKQLASNLQQVYAGALTCTDVDSNSDGSQLFISTCKVGQYGRGSSAITVQSTTGGTAHTIFTSQTLAVQQIRFLAPHTLLLLTFGELWKMNSDGTGLTRVIASADTYTGFTWGQYTQYSWSNVSRDGTYYALLSTSHGVDTSSTELAYASFNGGQLQSIASAFSGLVLPASEATIIGWTTM